MTRIYNLKKNINEAFMKNNEIVVVSKDFFCILAKYLFASFDIYLDCRDNPIYA